MLAVTQSIAALCLATGSTLHCRWLPSEWNVADGPSRGTSGPSAVKPLAIVCRVPPAAAAVTAGTTERKTGEAEEKGCEGGRDDGVVPAAVLPP
eukprot:7634417-Heterocapsa_arctica.AAC.1